MERCAFTAVIGLGVSMGQALVGMGGWLALKMATNWNRAFPVTSDMNRKDAVLALTRRARRAISALLGGAVSLTLGAVGGAIAAGKLNR